MHYCNRYTAFHRTSKISLFCAQFKDDIGKIVFPLSHHSNSIVLAFLHCLYPFGQSANRINTIVTEFKCESNGTRCVKGMKFLYWMKSDQYRISSAFSFGCAKAFFAFPLSCDSLNENWPYAEKKHNTRGKFISKASW